MYGFSTYQDIGYSKFLTKPPLFDKQSPSQYRGEIPFGAINGEALANLTLGNAKIRSQFRAWTAVVAQDGTGDFEEIQEAITYLNGLGGGDLLIRAGTYYPTSDITMETKIRVWGEGLAGTIIDFGSQGYGFRYPYNLTKFGQMAANLTTGPQSVEFHNLTIKNSTDKAIEIGACWKPVVEGVYFENNATDIDMQFVFRGQIERCYSRESNFFVTGSGGIGDFTIEKNTIEACEGSGVVVNAGFAGFVTVAGNYFYQTSETMNAAVIVGNPGSSSVGQMQVKGNYLFKTGTGVITYGVYIEDANCNDTLIADNHLDAAGTPISDSGTGTLTRDNIT